MNVIISRLRYNLFLFRLCHRIYRWNEDIILS